MMESNYKEDKIDCHDYNVFLQAVGLLMTPKNIDSCSSIEEELQSSITQVSAIYDFAETNCNDDNISWKFVRLSCEVLQLLKKALPNSEILSVAQQKTIRACIDKVICLELLPNMLLGIGLGPLAHPVRVHMNIVPKENLTDMEKYKHLKYVTATLLELNKAQHFHHFIVPHFLGDILAALCQLAFVPFKKPKENDTDGITNEEYLSLTETKRRFNVILENLTAEIYQPIVIKELMLIFGVKGIPLVVKRGVNQLLAKLLIKPGGVLATVRAITDASNTAAPTYSTQVNNVAKLIATPHCGMSEEKYLEIIGPQILELLDSKESDFIRVAVECCKCLSDANFQTYVLRPVVSCLSAPSITEPDINLCVHRLHKCFAIPASDLWSVPVGFLVPYIKTIFHMYCKIYQSASHLRTFVEDLVWCVLSKVGESELDNVFKLLIYDEKQADIHECTVEFGFGDEGGLKIVTENNERSLEEFGDALMIMLERRDDQGAIGNSLFVLMLRLSTDEEMKTDLEKYLITIKLLAVLSENTKVQKTISKNPKHIISFIKSFITDHSSVCSDGLEVLCLALMILTIILNDIRGSKQPDWSQFKDLVSPLKEICTTTNNLELKTLAEEAYSMIVSQGALKNMEVKSNELGKEKSKLNKVDISCDQALTDACDPLLPVRGHAMLILAKLISKGDKEAVAKKEAILCIFKENLKHEDSYLYLAAIKGLAALAAEFPDTIMMALIEELSREDRNEPNVRLKVGETLVAVVRLLGELVPTYKAELLNAFLAGCRDPDHLVRASSLANLGEVCRLLGFRVGTIIAEILECVRSIAQTDKVVEPRRAAVMVVAMLLKGLDKDMLLVLQDFLLELYRTLKFIYTRDSDDVTRLHAQLALEELNVAMTAFLRPQEVLAKKIFVLDAPP